MKPNTLSEEQLEHFYINVLAQLKVTRQEWQIILESGILPDLIESIRTGRHLVRKAVRLALGLDEWPKPVHFDVTVYLNRNLTMRKAAKLTGCPRQPSDNIPDRPFLGAREENRIVTIFHFGKGRQMKHYEILEELKAYGYRPVLLEELLALSAQHPHLQTKFPIAGVGCHEDTHHFWMIDCPFVTGGGPRKRRVNGNFKNGGVIYDFYRVAAVLDPSILPTKNLSFSSTTEDKEVTFVDGQHKAMCSV